MATRVRRDIWTLHQQEGLWNDTVLAYALGVGVLKNDELGNPPSWSWRHQTQVHGMASDPLDGLRRQCQHSSWYFLPWHRMYLLYYEQIIRAAIATLDEIDESVKQSWALPYWDYCRKSARELPPAFRKEQLPDGRANPLHEPVRNPGINDGRYGLVDDQVRAANWWKEKFFSTAQPVDSFGGPITGWNHGGRRGEPMGAVETTPHGDVHRFIGGKMADFTTAASDPIFWLHHCNIDRIWEVWRNAQPGPSDPTSGGWLTQTFDFLDAGGQRQPMQPSDVGDTIGLGYSYEDVSPPPEDCLTAKERAVTEFIEDAEARRNDAEARELPPQSIGSSDADTVLSRSEVDVAISLAEDEQLIARQGRAGPGRMLLYVRDIRSSAPPTLGYSLYLVGQQTEDLYLVGSLPLFGLQEAMEDDESHAIEYCFEITDIVGEMTAQDDWDPAQARLRIRPSNPMAAELAEDAPNVTIGTFDFAYQ